MIYYLYCISVVWELAPQSSTLEIQVRFTEGQNIDKLVNSDLVILLLKTNYGRDRKPNLAVLVVWNTSSASAKTLVPEGASHYTAFIGNWLTIIHRFLALSTHWRSLSSRK